MFAAYAASLSEETPLEGLALGEQPEPVVRPGWTTVHVRAASLNHHDVFALRGVALRETPMILGTDASGVDEDGNPVVVHAVIPTDAWTGDETLDPGRTLLSEKWPGTFAQMVAVPRKNLVPKPEGLSFEEAACLPTAWLTAYRMIFGRANAAPGSTILVQGAGGGVPTALVRIAATAGFRVWVTSRDESKRQRAMELGANQAFAPGQRLPERVDAVMDSVGNATWKDSVRALRPGGTLVTCGATSGYQGVTELNRIFFQQLRVVGSTMGTREELAGLLRFLDQTGVRPVIEATMPLTDAATGFKKMIEGDVFGKIVFTLDD